jgi:hypothetical protein
MSADWIKTAKVGDKVVCVDPTNDPFIKNVTKGRVYTIRGFIEWYGEVGFYLEELTNEMCLVGVEWAYRSDRFRPVHPRKTDISIFTDMLKTEPVREDA